MKQFTKNTNIAAVILCAFAAQAQAQSNVTVYGVVDLGFAKTTGASTVERENHASRLGFKGTESLGDGLSALFQMESEVLADTGAVKGGLFDRQANVGLQGGFGTVLLGRTKNLLDGAISRVEPFGADGVVGKVNEAMLRSRVGASRVSNALTYNSPKMSGVGFGAQYSLSEVSGAANGIDLLVTYDQGPLALHAGYEQAVQTLASSNKPTLFVLGGGYSFGDATLTAAYTKGNTKVAATGKFTSYLLGLKYKIGNGDAKAVFGRQTQSNNKVSGLETVKEFGVGYDHHISKRTDLYAYLGRESVTSLTSYQFGISHKF